MMGKTHGGRIYNRKGVKLKQGSLQMEDDRMNLERSDKKRISGTSRCSSSKGLASAHSCGKVGEGGGQTLSEGDVALLPCLTPHAAMSKRSARGLPCFTRC